MKLPSVPLTFCSKTGIKRFTTRFCCSTTVLYIKPFETTYLKRSHFSLNNFCLSWNWKFKQFTGEMNIFGCKRTHYLNALRFLEKLSS